MPGRFLSHRRAVARQATVLSAADIFGVGDEGVWMSGHVDHARDLGEFGVKEIQTSLDVLLADESMGSLRAGDKVAFHLQHFEARVVLGSRQQVEHGAGLDRCHRQHRETQEPRERYGALVLG